jgi:hypothetical protein
VATEWRGLYLTAGVGAAIAALLVPAHIAAFVAWPPPLEGTALDWFAVFDRSALIGFVSMDLFLMADYALLVPIYLGLYVALRERSPSLALLGTGFGLASMAIYFASNPAIEMWTLSQQYAAATDDAQRALIAAAGEATIVRYQGTAFHTNYLLGSLAGMLVSWAMLREPAFGRVAGWMGVLGNLIGYGLYLPVVGLLLSVLSGPLLWVWFILVARGFFRLARS